MATTALTICARCGGTGPFAEGACGRCGTRVDERPAGPPIAARCPVCGTRPVAGRTSCPGCGLAIPWRGRDGPLEVTARRWAAWQVAAAASALVVVTTLVVLLLARDGPPRLDARWQVDLPATVEGSPVVTGDTALVATADGTLVAVDAHDGTPLWRLLTEQRVTAPVAAAGDLAVVATTGDGGVGLVFGVDMRTGNERWRVETDVPVTEAPAIDERGVYLSRGDVSAHDSATGEQRWRRQIEGGAGALAVGDGTVVAVGGDGVVALANQSGDVRWSSGGGRPEVAPGIVGDLAVMGDGTGSIVARGLDRGQERWRIGVGGQLLQPVVAGPDVAVVATSRGLLAFDVTDGAERWRAGPRGDQRLRAASDGTVVSVRSGSGVLLVDGLTGRVVASTRLRQPKGAEPAGAPALTARESLVLGEGDEVVALRSASR